MTLWIKTSQGWVVPKRVWQKQPAVSSLPHDTHGIWYNARYLWVKLDGTWIKVHTSEPEPVIIKETLKVEIVTGTRNVVEVVNPYLGEFVYRKAGESTWITGRKNPLTLDVATKYEFAHSVTDPVVTLTTLKLTDPPKDWITHTTLIAPQRFQTFDLITKTQVYPARKDDLKKRPEDGKLDWVASTLNNFAGYPLFQGTSPKAMYLSKLTYTKGIEKILAEVKNDVTNVRAAKLYLKKTPDHATYTRPESDNVLPKARMFAASNLVAGTAAIKDLDLSTLYETPVSTFTTTNDSVITVPENILTKVVKDKKSIAFCDVGRVDIPGDVTDISWNLLAPQDKSYQFSFLAPGVANGVLKETPKSGYLEVTWWGPDSVALPSTLPIELTDFEHITELYESVLNRVEITQDALKAVLGDILEAVNHITSGDDDVIEPERLENTIWKQLWGSELVAKLSQADITKEIEDKMQEVLILAEKALASGNLANNRADNQQIRAVIQTLEKLLKYLDTEYFAAIEAKDKAEDTVKDWLSWANGRSYTVELFNLRKEIEKNEDLLSIANDDKQVILDRIEDKVAALTTQEADKIAALTSYMNALIDHQKNPTDDAKKTAMENALANYNNKKGIYDSEVAIINNLETVAMRQVDKRINDLNSQLTRQRRQEQRLLKQLEDGFKAQLKTYYTALHNLLFK